MLVAAIQMTSGPDKAHNLETATHLVREAARRGARFVGLPETFNWFGHESEKLSAAEPLDGPSLKAMSNLAKELSITLLAGSVLEHAEGMKVFNTSVLFGPDGERLAVYRKIHLFDVELRDGSTYRESALTLPGKEVAVAKTELGTIGLSVCYDLRFPELYRQASAQGATLLAVPAAFTLTTGKDHWEVLLRARAIENQCYVVAPAQWGSHPNGKQTYGHAMVIDPWGLVIARASEGEGMALGEMSHELLARVRQSLPSLAHRRL